MGVGKDGGVESLCGQRGGRRARKSVGRNEMVGWHPAAVQARPQVSGQLR